ncbi:MmcB family DNA repair protein [Martelella sp. AMO21009]
MAIVDLHGKNPTADGRQSDRAIMVRRGVQHLLKHMRVSAIAEMTLRSGRRADLICLSEKGEIWIIEIKTSIEDFRVDRKWPEYRDFCDRLFFATHADVPLEIFPEDCGLLLADRYGAEMIRPAPEHKLAAARRKVLTLAFARNAADRLTFAELVLEKLEAEGVDVRI